MTTEEPTGLSLSLDDMIKTQQESSRSYGPDRKKRSSHQTASRHHGGDDLRRHHDTNRQQFNNRGDHSNTRHNNNKNAGNWFCPGCGFECFAFRDTCMKCGAQKSTSLNTGNRMQRHQPYSTQNHRRDMNAQLNNDNQQYRKSQQQCFVEQETGVVVFKFKQTEIVRITPQGDISINTGGFYGRQTLQSLNDALNPLNIRVTVPSGDIKNGEWNISDGKSLLRYSDGIVLHAKGPMHVSRGQEMFQAFQNPRPDAASNADAMKFGMMPPLMGGFGQGMPMMMMGGGRQGGFSPY